MDKPKTQKEILEYMKRLIQLNKWDEVRKLRPRLRKYYDYNKSYITVPKYKQSRAKIIDEFNEL